MLQPRCQFAGAHIHKGVLKAGIALFPREGGLSYPRHYVSRPIIPEGGYPGSKDEHGQPVDWDDYRAWLGSLPTRMVLNPCLTHFIRIDPATTLTQLESEIQRIFTPDVLTSIDAFLATRGKDERADMSRLRRMMNSPERLGTKLILPEGYDEDILVAEADAKFKGLSGELDGEGNLLPYEPGTIDVGAAATDRGGLSVIYVSGNYITNISYNNAANNTGTIDTVESWWHTADSGNSIKVGTFQDNGSDSFTCHDAESIGEQSPGSKQTATGLDIDINSGEYIGCDARAAYTTRIENDYSGGSGVYWAYGQFCDATDTNTFSFLDGDAISLYGTGSGQVTEKSGSDTGSGTDVLAARLASTTEAGTGAEASELTTSGVVITGDTGAGSEAVASREMVMAETGQALDTTTAPAAAIVVGDSGFGADYSGMPEAAYGNDTGQGRDTVRAKIEMAGAGVAMRLPGRPGQVSPSRKEVSG